MKPNSNDYRNMHREVNRVKTDKHSPNVLFELWYGKRVIRRNMDRDTAYRLKGFMEKDANYRLQKFTVKPMV